LFKHNAILHQKLNLRNEQSSNYNSSTGGDAIPHKRKYPMKDLDNTFIEIAQIIEDARDNAYRKVNEELILMYRKVGQFLSEKSKEASYGDGYIDSLADHIQNQFPGIKGFTRRGLYRMKQFYETYSDNEKGAVALRQSKKQPGNPKKGCPVAAFIV